MTWFKSKPMLYLSAVVFLGAAIYAAKSSHYRITGSGTDFNAYYVAAKAILENNAAELYTVSVESREGFTYIYPPLFALMLVPICFFSKGMASIIWFFCNLFFAAHSLFLLTKRLNPTSPKHFFPQVILWLVIAYCVDCAQLGQIHLLLLYLIVLAWSFFGEHKKYQVASTFFLAMATCIKILPGLICVVYLIKGRWRALLLFCFWIFIFIFVIPFSFLGKKTSWELTKTFYQFQIRPFVTLESQQSALYQRTTQKKTINDQDLGALLQRHLCEDPKLPEQYAWMNIASWPIKEVRQTMFLLFALILLISCGSALWFELSANLPPALRTHLYFSLFTVVSILISPRIRMLYLSELMLPYSVMLHLFFVSKDKTIRNILCGSVMASFILISVMMPFKLGRALTPVCWALGILWAAHIAVFIRMAKFKPEPPLLH